MNLIKGEKMKAQQPKLRPRRDEDSEHFCNYFYGLSEKRNKMKMKKK
jgi:hypothetical protein